MVHDAHCVSAIVHAALCVSVITEVGPDIHQTLEGTGTLVIEEGDGTTITVTQAADDDTEVRATAGFSVPISVIGRENLSVISVENETYPLQAEKT